MQKIITIVLILINIFFVQNTLAININNTNYTNYDIIQFFKKELTEENNIQYVIVPRGVIISIRSDLIFDNNCTGLSDDGKKIIDKISYIILQLRIPCVVESNVMNLCKKQTPYDKWEFSMMQSENIVNYMIHKNKINPQKIFALGFGDILRLKEIKHYDRIDFVILNYKKFDGEN